MAKHNPLTLKMAINLAAPHTWPAAIMPTLVALCVASNSTPLSVTMSLTLLVIVTLMQSAVNTFNDYYDFVKGSDSADDYVDPSDAVLVYNDVDPKAALKLAIAMLVCAFALGIYAIVKAGFVPLVIALIGALFVVLYSAGKSPISYLPLGEAVSGIVMGGLIPLAVYQVVTGKLDFAMLLLAIPTIIGVGLIMFTNNTCDIERDIDAGRRTLPVLLGRESSVRAYRIALIVYHHQRCSRCDTWLDRCPVHVACRLSVGQSPLCQPHDTRAQAPSHAPDSQRQHRPRSLLLCSAFSTCHSYARALAPENLHLVGKDRIELRNIEAFQQIRSRTGLVRID